KRPTHKHLYSNTKTGRCLSLKRGAGIQTANQALISVSEIFFTEPKDILSWMAVPGKLFAEEKKIPLQAPGTPTPKNRLIQGHRPVAPSTMPILLMPYAQAIMMTCTAISTKASFHHRFLCWPIF